MQAASEAALLAAAPTAAEEQSEEGQRRRPQLLLPASAFEGKARLPSKVQFNTTPSSSQVYVTPCDRATTEWRVQNCPFAPTKRPNQVSAVYAASPTASVRSAASQAFPADPWALHACRSYDASPMAAGGMSVRSMRSAGGLSRAASARSLNTPMNASTAWRTEVCPGAPARGDDLQICSSAEASPRSVASYGIPPQPLRLSLATPGSTPTHVSPSGATPKYMGLFEGLDAVSAPWPVRRLQRAITIGHCTSLAPTPECSPMSSCSPMNTGFCVGTPGGSTCRVWQQAVIFEDTPDTIGSPFHLAGFDEAPQTDLDALSPQGFDGISPIEHQQTPKMTSLDSVSSEETVTTICSDGKMKMMGEAETNVGQVGEPAFDWARDMGA
eukprot:TRINITY_DN111983_c0_g1_i1.p1 TRINITY_DN111983_c0_g1~~TRINITY_DN111983_c0_g1_i1.p1  ORF type:complete len:384 (-),score=68.82 TRINITY_DN111983_c0_g1_i1:105-1256(-)